MTVPDSPENKCPTVECPDCGGMGSGEGGFRGGKKWKAICPGCGGSGRINTSGDFIGDKPGLGEHSCHEDCPCSPSPDRETGGSEADRLAYSQYQLRSGLRDLIAWNEDVPGAKIQALLDATTPSAPSAAPTGPGAGENRVHEGYGRKWEQVPHSSALREVFDDGDPGSGDWDQCVYHMIGGRVQRFVMEPSRSDSEGELRARIEELELSLKQADEELARVTRAAVKGPDGYDYHWCPGVGWCPGCPPVPKEEA